MTDAETAADNKHQADMDKHPKDYFVPNFGVDHDIVSTQENMRKQGIALKGLVQRKSIPACNSAEFPDCVTNAETAADKKHQADMDKHPKDYFIPNFGVDHDIVSTQENIRKQEAAAKKAGTIKGLAQLVHAKHS